MCRILQWMYERVAWSMQDCISRRSFQESILVKEIIFLHSESECMPTEAEGLNCHMNCRIIVVLQSVLQMIP